ncbi:hypothetical protein ACH5AJ_32890 [Streptomyces rochei]|uniref:hypothetical protein n=1 Tax=Streptomyces TaxID=1883 RepID=UPI000FBDC52C|nr:MULTISPECIES: hypothetical protein [unclassified Streptomyces]RSS24279.1 hypothetical protein EF916_27585 [Streptomyces sp. WAC08452]RSS68577.1 hypothetical protein EF911_32920 [Streptomyces sp. WAC06128]GGY98135.1 hypothetical protein GCM10010385_55060 [Streptomyces geysiriensis]
MTSSPVGRGRSDDPFDEIGDLALAVADKRRGLVAMAGTHEYDEAKTVDVCHVTDRALRRLLLHSQHPVNAMGFVLMAPADDWKDGQDHEEGHVAVVGCADWTGAEAKSLTGRDLAGPCVPVPRVDHREETRQAIARVPAMGTRRHHISRALG